MIGGLAHVFFSTYSQTFNDEDPMVTSGEPLEQVTTPRGPSMVSLNVAMKDEPNIELRCCSTCSKIP